MPRLGRARSSVLLILLLVIGGVIGAAPGGVRPGHADS